MTANNTKTSPITMIWDRCRSPKTVALSAVASAVLVSAALLGNTAYSSSSSGIQDVTNFLVSLVDGDKQHIRINTESTISVDGSHGAFGWGIPTGNANEFLVATTHGGVYDSETQSNATDPIWHTHLVKLFEDTDACPNAFRVQDLTLSDPSYAVSVKNNVIDIVGATHGDYLGQFGNTPLALGALETYTIATFTLNPADLSTSPPVVCVENVQLYNYQGDPSKIATVIGPAQPTS